MREREKQTSQEDLRVERIEEATIRMKTRVVPQVSKVIRVAQASSSWKKPLRLPLAALRDPLPGQSDQAWLLHRLDHIDDLISSIQNAHDISDESMQNEPNENGQRE